MPLQVPLDPSCRLLRVLNSQSLESSVKLGSTEDQRTIFGRIQRKKQESLVEDIEKKDIVKPIVCVLCFVVSTVILQAFFVRLQCGMM